MLRRWSLYTAAVALVITVSAAGPPASESASLSDHNSMEPRMKKLTPILAVETIEHALPFWEGLGFERTAEVPDGDALGFVMLEKDGIELMYQTIKGISDDMPALAEGLGSTLLFIEVEDLDAVEAALNDFELIRPRRTTFYGADEIVYREPAGHLVTFAQFAEENE